MSKKFHVRTKQNVNWGIEWYKKCINIFATFFSAVIKTSLFTKQQSVIQFVETCYLLFGEYLRICVLPEWVISNRVGDEWRES